MSCCVVDTATASPKLDIHFKSARFFYANFDRQLESGVTLSTVAGVCDNANVTIDNEAVISQDLVIGGVTLLQDRAVKFKWTGGAELTPSSDENCIRLTVTTSDGQTIVGDCPFTVVGKTGTFN